MPPTFSTRYPESRRRRWSVPGNWPACRRYAQRAGRVTARASCAFSSASRTKRSACRSAASAAASRRCLTASTASFRRLDTRASSSATYGAHASVAQAEAAGLRRMTVLRWSRGWRWRVTWPSCSGSLERRARGDADSPARSPPRGRRRDRFGNAVRCGEPCVPDEATVGAAASQREEGADRG
jgi:hypothetical protein